MSNYGWSCPLGSNFLPKPCMHSVIPISDSPTAPEDCDLGLSYKQRLSIAQNIPLHIAISIPVFSPSYNSTFSCFLASA